MSKCKGCKNPKCNRMDESKMTEEDLYQAKLTLVVIIMEMAVSVGEQGNWLYSPNSAICGRRPIDLFDREGIDSLIDLLIDIDKPVEWADVFRDKD